MKKKVLFMMTTLLISGSINAQTVTNGGFDGSTGYIGAPGVASPWFKGCAYNTSSNSGSNTPEVILDASNNVLQLKGAYNPYQGGATFNMESAEQWVGAIPAGTYTVTFDARNYLQTTGNPGIRLAVNLKNYTGCSWTTTHPNPQQLQEVISIPLVYNFNSYSATFCIPDNLNNELSYLEFGTIQQQSTSTYCNGIIDIDNVTLTNTSEPYDLAFDYQIDCLTGQIQVRPTSPMNPNLHDLFVVMENNPNDPNNLSDNGDTQHTTAWFNYTSNSQGWYTIPLAIDRNKNYYIKRGIWGDCMSWKELRKYNVELQPDNFNTNFSVSVFCNDANQPILSVTGANQQGKNPHHMFSLYEYFPGTNLQDQLLESVGWWQQSNASNYQYQQGPFTFSQVLDPSKHYYVKRGLWDACTPWAETRRYDIYAIPCPEFILSKSVSDQETIEGISLYPNPANEVLNIETSLEYDSFELFSVGGKHIGTYSDHTISIEELESGYYLLKVLKDGNVRATERFIKQ